MNSEKSVSKALSAHRWHREINRSEKREYDLAREAQTNIRRKIGKSNLLSFGLFVTDLVL